MHPTPLFKEESVRQTRFFSAIQLGRITDLIHLLNIHLLGAAGRSLLVVCYKN